MSEGCRLPSKSDGLHILTDNKYKYKEDICIGKTIIKVFMNGKNAEQRFLNFCRYVRAH